MRLDQTYNREAFVKFLRENFLPDFHQEERPVQIAETSVFERVTYLGASRDCDVSVFEIACTGASSNRRVTVTQRAFSILRQHGISNALIAFEHGAVWRFSLLTSKLILQDGKVQRIDSNPRRFSHMLGVDTKINTPYIYLVEKGRVTDLASLTQRFSIEAVNKQFYESIAALFTELVGGERRGQSYDGILSIHGVEKGSAKAQEFAVRLIGRIMFCWFLKEKKSDSGVSLVPESQLSLEAIREHPNYYHNVLEPLFFEVLNKHPKERRPEHRESPFNLIPYLNGGLFMQQKPDDHYNYCASTQSGAFGILTIPNEWFVSLFELLGTYNFTVDENTVYDMDLSIDPEMLGRIFENLLAEINPETGESLKKSTGSYYTPREIVDYMVDSSLLYYLWHKTGIDESKLKATMSYSKDESDEEFLDSLSVSERERIIIALSCLTALDPACGSGAFPIGMMQKVVYILQQVDVDAKIWFKKQISDISSPELRREVESRFRERNFNYLRKLGVIRESIFGVDIQTVATEIARLRCYLSLIIEERIDDNAENRGIRTLPNLDFKFISANSLIRLDVDSSQVIGQTSIYENDLTVELKTIRDEYFSADPECRMRLRNEFVAIQKQMFMRIIDEYTKQASARYTRLSHWSPFEYSSSDWFDADWMFGIKDGFDIVIGNPPYGLVNKKQNRHTSIMVSDTELSYYKSDKMYESAKGGMLNVFRLFICASYNLLKPHGNFCLIFPMAYMCDLSAANLRKQIFHNAKTLYIDAFPERDNEKKRVFEAVKMSVCILGIQKTPPNEADVFTLRVNDDRYIDANTPVSLIQACAIRQIDSFGMAIPIATQAEFDLLAKITSSRKRLSEISKCYEGELHLTADKVYLTTEITEGIVIRGAQVQRYHITSELSQGEALYLRQTKYLAEATSLRSTHHKLRRILMQRITGVNEKTRLKMTLVDAGIFCANSVNYILPPEHYCSIEYLLGLLNSKVINWYFSKFSTNSNVNGYEVDNLPIRKGESEDRIAALAMEITQVKQSDPAADTSALEAEIDRLVYELYGLTEYEIKVVEGEV